MREPRLKEPRLKEPRLRGPRPTLGSRVVPAVLVFALVAGCSHAAAPSAAPPGQGALASPSPSVSVMLSGGPTPTPTGAPTPTNVPSPTSTPALPVSLGTVLLVPGFGGSTDGLAPIAAALRKAGRHVRIVALPNRASEGFKRQALTLEAAVRSEEKLGHGPVDIVAHSNGGVLARYWARHYRGASRVRVVVTLGAPQHGTTLADFAYAAAPALCTPACVDVRPASALLRALNAGKDSTAIRWVSVYTDNDNVVLPPTSAVLRGALNVRLQAVCADAAVDHSGLLGDSLALGLVLDELQLPGPRVERLADCVRLRALGAN